MAESAREVAFKVLKDAEKNRTYSNIAVDRALSQSELSGADRGLVTAIVMGVVERKLTLDAIISSLSQKGEQTDSDARVLLRMGIYQLYFLDRIPDHAAVNETVALAPKRLRGFINAVLREFLRRRESGRLESLFPSREEDMLGYLSVKYSFPKDVCAEFIKIYGTERTEVIFEKFNSAPPLTLRINTLKISRDDYAGRLRESGIDFRLSDRLENAVLLDGVAYNELPGVDEGWFFIQDEASQICVEALGAESGETIVDVCSCPGSKSFGSAIRMANEGKIYSFDLHKSKLPLIEKNAERLGISIIGTAERDGRTPDESLFGRADRVLCDVPCSGLGVIAKKPEIRYKSISEFERLPEIQYEILSASARYVRKGGILVYSTCTVLPRENRENVERFLSEHKEFEAVDFRVGELASSCGMLSLSPDRDGTDGFFVAKMRRKENV
jgi:16S rRNA (cytosine967-C5)-methyltransferase